MVCKEEGWAGLGTYSVSGEHMSIGNRLGGGVVMVHLAQVTVSALTALCVLLKHWRQQ